MKRPVLTFLALIALASAAPVLGAATEEKAPAAAEKAAEPGVGCMPGGGCCGSPACAAASAQAQPKAAGAKRKGKRAATATCPCGRMKPAM